MILGGSNLAHYLVDRGLMTLESVVDGDFFVVDIARRNQNFKVIRREGPGFFVKQVRDGSPEAVTSLNCEATCYQLAQSDSELEPLATLVPRFCSYDPLNHVLIVELLANGENLREHSERTGSFSPEIARQLGTALGKYHSVPISRISNGASAAAFQVRKPWILSFHLQTFPPGTINAGTAELHNILRSYPEYTQALEEVSEDWHVDCLIHGDLKWDNCVVYPAEDGAGFRFKVVDWELATLGDACWDLGAILQSYLTSWVFSMPDTGMSPAAMLMRQARFPLDHMAPAIGAFWDAYASARKIVNHQARELLERSMKHGAARMVQTVYEMTSFSAQMSSVAARVLQLSYNILRDTPDAVDSLLAA